jgi:predicted NBD/HSP70 family sugar kinase
MVTGDGAYIKKINRGLILKHIMEHGMISRADLSKITGLNKATISVQVADLLAEELIYETQQEHNSVGRRPIMLSINNEAGFVLGIDLDYKHIQFTVSDLQGYPVHYEAMELETTNFDDIVQVLITEIKKLQTQFADSRYGLIHVLIGIHGTVNNDEMIFFVPKYQWENKNLKHELLKQLDIEITVENNANLSAFAEKVYNYQQSNNLLSLILTSGIGAGMMIDGELHKGFHGFAGEMGHMIISPDGKPCTCGNHGCWELYAAEPGFFAQLAEILNRPALTYADIRKLIDEKNPAACAQMEHFIKYLAVGLNNIINLYNPETLILNSAILQMYPEATRKLEKQLVSSVSHYRELVLSDLGNKSCVMGACALGIKQFLDVPQLILHGKDQYIAFDSHAELVY